MLLNSKYTLIILLIHLCYKHCFPSQCFYFITLLKCIRECGNHFQQLANFPDDVCALYGTACSILPYFSLLFQNESHSIRLIGKTYLSAWVSENSSGSYTAGPTMFLLGWKTTRVLNLWIWVTVGSGGPVICQISEFIPCFLDRKLTLQSFNSTLRKISCR